MAELNQISVTSGIPSAGTGEVPTLAPVRDALQAVVALLTVPDTFVAGQKAIAVTGTAVALSATSVPLQNGVTIQANPDNAGPVVVGPTGVANTVDGTGNGKVLQPGQSWALAVANLNVVFINGAAGDWVDWSAN